MFDPNLVQNNFLFLYGGGSTYTMPYRKGETGNGKALS